MNDRQATHQCRPDDWAEEYYGYRCRVCGTFVPFGCEPWVPDDDEVADMVRAAVNEHLRASPVVDAARGGPGR